MLNTLPNLIYKYLPNNYIIAKFGVNRLIFIPIQNRKTCTILNLEIPSLPQSSNYRFVWIPGKLNISKYKKS